MSDKTEHPPVPEAFQKLGVRPSILRALAEMKYEKPSEIQELLIPKALTGIDLLGQARTGTGKTAAFGIPIVQRAIKGLATQAIILVPTRELAVQVDSELKRMAQFTPIRTVPVYGGQKIMAQMKFLKHGPEILIGTPGRVIDLLDRRIINFENIRFVVLDEVDRMLDIGFRDDIRNILSRVKGVRRRVFEEEMTHEQGQDGPSSYGHEGSSQRPGRSDLRHERDDDFDDDRGGGEEGHDDRAFEKGHGAHVDDGHVDPHADRGGHQTIFVSATFTEEIERLARRYMREPVEKLVAPGADDKPTVEKVEQYYLPVQPWDKYRLLRSLLIHENPDLAIVFCKTKRGAEKLAKRLHSDGIECREIHGNLAQNKRDRVMQGFRKGKFDVLIATDLASRGIDVADISHIINYDIPEDPEVYVHRIGRTARMGAEGKAFMFVGKEQGDELTKIENLINMVIPKAEVPGFEPNPPPADWTDQPPGSFTPTGPAKPVVNRFQQVYGARPQPTSGEAASTPDTPAVALPPRTIGSKIPITRRHKRRR